MGYQLFFILKRKNMLVVTLYLSREVEEELVVMNIHDYM